MFNVFKRNNMGLGAFEDPLDLRDYIYDDIVMGAEPFTEDDWKKGYNIEEILDFELPMKNQNGSLSCVGQGTAYYAGVLNMVEEKIYKEISAKGFYSQIFLQGGGAYIRESIKLLVDWGAVTEVIVSSYDNKKPPSEDFMRDLSWKNERVDKLAKTYQAKRYAVIGARDNMDLFARAIRDNHGVVGGVYVGNNGSWRTNEPTPSNRTGGHCIYYGKFGIDEKGKYIASPNEWGTSRGKDALHPDGWQKLRKDYFNGLYQFNPWLVIDAPNPITNPNIIAILKEYEHKFVIEGEGPGRKGLVIDGLLCPIGKEREANASIYVQNNNGYGITVSTVLYDQFPKGPQF